MSDTEGHDPTRCPICGGAFKDETWQRCNHEVDWYRQWIGEEQDLLKIALDALAVIANGDSEDPTATADQALAAIHAERNKG